MKMHRVVRPSYLASAVCAVVLGSLASRTEAGVIYNTGNVQYTNVNISSDQHGFTIWGEVDSTGIMVSFKGFGPSPYPAVELHGQHGVAFLEAHNPSDILHRMTISAPAGWGFDAMDWKLDASLPSDGLVQFKSYDADENLIPVSAGSDIFLFDHDGQNPFTASAQADPGTIISKLEITSSSTTGANPLIAPIRDLKQVSVNLVPIPEPVTAALSGALLLLVARRRIVAGERSLY